MNYLLDTHLILWALVDDKRIDPFRTIIANPDNEIYFSAASIWEIAIKHEKGNLSFAPNEVETACLEQAYLPLSIKPKHAAATSELEYPDDIVPHKDPFDRMLIAQAKTEGMILLTADEKILKFNEYCIRKTT